jgi:hypothetical protein
VKKSLRTGGVNFVSQKQNRKLFFNQKFQHTSVEDNTNALFVEKLRGCKVDGHQLKVFTNFFEKIVYNLDSYCIIFFIYTIEK